MIFGMLSPFLSVDYPNYLSLKFNRWFFGNKEIAKALLKKEESVAKSIYSGL